MTPPLIGRTDFHDVKGSMTMRTKYVVWLVALSCCRAAADTATSNANQSTHVLLHSPNGTINAIMELPVTGKGRVVSVPDLNLIWIGAPLPGEVFVCSSNSIVRIAPDCDTLLVDRQAIRLHGSAAEKQRDRNRVIGEFERRDQEGRAFESVQKLSLGEKLLGARSLSPFLPPPERVRPARPATITDVHFQGGHLHVTLVGENKTEVRLTFDADMNLVTGEINGKSVYPRAHAVPSQPEAMK